MSTLHTSAADGLSESLKRLKSAMTSAILDQTQSERLEQNALTVSRTTEAQADASAMHGYMALFLLAAVQVPAFSDCRDSHL